MRKTLSVVQILIALGAFLLPFIDGMFVWRCYSFLLDISQNEKSLQNMMVVQGIGGGPVLYPIFNIILIVLMLYCVVSLFNEEKFAGKKITIAIPSAALLLSFIMIQAAGNYVEHFEQNGQHRTVSIDVNALAYVELALLIGAVVIECYKQIKLSNN